MSFLAEGTPITKETIDEAVENLALACALGVRQYEAIVKLIENGKLEAHLVPVPTRSGSALSFDGSSLSMASWYGMSKRLKKAGFRVVRSKLPHGFEYKLYWGSIRKEKDSNEY